MMKKRRRRRPEQVIRLLQDGEAMLAAGKSAAEVYQKLEVSEATWMRWKKQYGGMKSDEAKRLRELDGKQTSERIACGVRAGQADPERGSGGKLLSPARRREAIDQVQRNCEVSQRRACRVLNQPLSTQRYRAVFKADESILLKRILALVNEFPRFGYRQITRLLRSEGWRVNAKRIYRLWRREGLTVPQKKMKRRRLGSSTGGVIRRRASGRNDVWSVDFIFDRTANGHALKILVVIDEYTRECLVLDVRRRLNSDDFISELTNIMRSRGTPGYIRSDNGSEFIAQRVQEFLGRLDIQTSYIEPGSPWQNGYVESFNSRFRDECLACEEFRTVMEARQVVRAWQRSYNDHRPHGSLGGLTPTEYSR